MCLLHAPQLGPENSSTVSSVTALHIPSASLDVFHTGMTREIRNRKNLAHLVHTMCFSWEQPELSQGLKGKELFISISFHGFN